VVVEIISDNAIIRIAQTKWDGIVYMDVRNGEVCTRPKGEFHRIFEPVTDGDKG
jgi:hypothetical protein